MTDIEKMIAAGATPESIYKEALAAAEAQNRAKKNEKLNKVRTQFITAFAAYMEMVTGEKMDTAQCAEMERDFKNMEQLINRLAH